MQQASQKSKILAGVIVTVCMCIIPAMAYVLTQALLPSVRSLVQSFSLNMPAGAYNNCDGDRSLCHTRNLHAIRALLYDRFILVLVYRHGAPLCRRHGKRILDVDLTLRGREEE